MLVVALWLLITGGLHLDGAMDTADGLAVQQPERRLAVMADSVTGAFGAMVAVVIIVLKVCAIAEIATDRGYALMMAAGWSRWGQVLAIAWYPYLKAEGKGAFHKQGIKLPQDVLLGLLVILGVTGVQIYLDTNAGLTMGWKSIECSAIAIATGYYFHRRLGGHTGDTYGAVVEWTEALILCLGTIIIRPW
jgi:adenosylcobinamide-GDP ribazoletransferase